MNVGSNSDIYANNTQLLKGEDVVRDELKLRDTYMHFFNCVYVANLISGSLFHCFKTMEPWKKKTESQS